ncbi:hypothetical protein GGR54DRAFT_411504 [Hypoxylon sp. NC1633]|nr:hypothetical protein GGR54DRAFT_411504 [Hypoxylon sp. NC1633]
MSTKANAKSEPRSSSPEPASMPLTDDGTVWRKRLYATDSKVHLDRYVQVVPWRNKLRVDIRGYLARFDRLQPTKSGVSLTLEEFEYLVYLIPQIKDEIKRRVGDDAPDHRTWTFPN